MDLTGIENEAEFFPAGTLSDVLEVELQDITGRWSRELEGANPVTRLSGSADTYLRLYRQLLNTTDKNLRNELYSESMALVSTALGYDVKRSSETLALDAGSLARVMNKTFDADGKQALWIVETPAPAAGEEQADPLGQAFDPEQYDNDEQEHAELEKTIEELLADGIFDLPDAPRYVLVVGASQWVLVDQRKWPARSVLRFDLQEIFSRQDRDTFRVMACLVAREARVPATGIPIADRLEEEAQRNANAVTTSLKRTVRDAIEILGQEVLDVTGGKFPTGPKRGVWIDGPTLSLECLRYMYRLLFLLYAESNPRLRILDLKDPLYASGYSMEALRDLESVRLRTPQEKNGSYLWDSLQQVLRLLYSGESHVLKLPAVKVSLLDPESTPLLNSVSLRNEAVQRIIRQLSLRSSKKSTGRISYSKLGIGQLGAVYETLISFTGTVAKEDMIELKGDSKDRAALETDDADDVDDEVNEANCVAVDEDDEEAESRVDKVDLLAPTYFVPRRRITEFNPEAVVFEGTQAKIYLKGSFTYRLSGRDREKTAAYYTPEPLARLLVKHLLMERCKDLAADEILELKILEPAMGSAAFLVETTNQLTDLYLERKQVEVGLVIPQEEILLEKQKVRSYIADRNCFGVDLNPTAVELGAISLWLNGLYKGDFSPWFGDQLHAGNSLIGARRAVYPATQLKGATADLWFKNPPKEIGWKEERPENTVYQWLLPAGDMAAFEKDKTIKEFAGDHQARIKAWRSGGFFKPLEPHEINLVKRLTNVADELFEIVAAEIARTRDAANDEITIWPDRLMSGAKGIGYQKKEILKQRLLGEDHAHNTLPFKRLKTAMDAWCALWLWPIEKAEKLPSRQEFFEGMKILLEGGFSADGSLSVGSEDDFAVGMGDLFEQQIAEPTKKYNVGLFQETNVEAFIEEYEWLQVATEVASETRFMHSELLFADILKTRGGFDLIVGNPPWDKPSWNSATVLGDIDPKFLKLKAHEAGDYKHFILEDSDIRREYLQEFSSMRGMINFSSSYQNFPFTGSGSNNLYKCFIDLSFRLTNISGFVALIHQDGHLASPKGELFRKHIYKRLRKSFEFSNKITSKNFSEILHTRRFSLNIYGPSRESISFTKFTNAFLASQIDESYSHDGSGECSGIKVNGKWDTRGHKNRLINIDLEYLKAICAFQGNSPSFDNAIKTPFMHPLSQQLASTIVKLSKSDTLQSKTNLMHVMNFGDESILQSENIITRRVGWPDLKGLYVISSPCLYAGSCCAKTPRSDYRVPQHCDVVDPSSIDSYRSRSIFTLTEEAIKSGWGNGFRTPDDDQVIDNYRYAFRRRVDLGTERSFTGALIPPEAIHTDQITAVSFKDSETLFSVTAVCLSIISDFLIKSLRLGDIREAALLRMLKIELTEQIQSRVLLLSAVSADFSRLLHAHKGCLEKFQWSNSQLTGLRDIHKISTTSQSVPLNFLERRQLLLELDVLVTRQIGLDLDEFLSVLTAFPLLLQNEETTYYDQLGNIVYSDMSGYQKLGFLDPRGRKPILKTWKENHLEKEVLRCDSVDETLPNETDFRVPQREFFGPFFKCDRVEDYKRAWTHFEKLEQEGAA